MDGCPLAGYGVGVGVIDPLAAEGTDVAGVEEMVAATPTEEGVCEPG